VLMGALMIGLFNFLGFFVGSIGYLVSIVIVGLIIIEEVINSAR